MKNSRKKNPFIIPAGIAVCIAGVAVFISLHILSLRFAAPDTGETSPADITSGEVSAGSQNGIMPEPDNVRARQTPPPPPSPVPVPPGIDAYKTNLTGDEHITLRMDESDIYKGYLLLVNSDHRYDIPGDLDLVSILNTKTVPYRVSGSGARLRATIMQPFDEMMQGFIDETGRNIIYVLSAFRDYQSQQWTLNNYIYLEGRAAALRRAKEPGFSEHHTGLAFDLATYADGMRHSFDYFDITKWFPGNSQKYGFILRYPRDKVSITNTIYEPWHYRYVGLPHARIMTDKNWALEEYIDKIKEYTLQEPLRAEYNGIHYEIFYSDSIYIDIPAQAEYDISGNNVDGFIVTIYNRYDRLTNVSRG